MNQLLKIKIPSDYDGLMIKEILFDRYNFSRKSLSRVKNEKGILLNGEHVYVTVRVKKDDLLEVLVPNETSEDIIPQFIPLDIIYEDEDIIVINKPPNIVVHPTRNHYTGTIANGLFYYWESQGKKYRFRPVNRLDKNTSGLFIVAKNQYSHHKLALQMQDKTLKRIYHAIVHGKFEKQNGVVNAPIVKDQTHSMRRLVSFENPNAKPALTFYQVLQSSDNYSLVRLQLGTGRTHQIRVHMSWLNHPLVGDDLYGGELNDLERQALHAIELTFNHPITNKQFNFFSQYPNDFNSFLLKYNFTQ